MNLPSFVILHGDLEAEITVLEYLLRIVFYLFAFGSVAAIVFWGLDVISAIRSKIVEK